MDEEILYRIALLQLPGIGSLYAKVLTDYFKSAKELFYAKKQELTIIPGIGPVLLKTLLSQKQKTTALNRAEYELSFIQKNNIQTLLHDEEDFPKNLKECSDSPYLLFSLGNYRPSPQKCIAIVGTRKNTAYGTDVTERIVEELKGENICIVSGLAYGIDTVAHKACIKHNVETIGVLAHGLDALYPASNRKLAKDMLENGGLLTEFISKTNPDRENFPKRNRIVAGMADATVIVEAAAKGGALITAHIAHGYNRDVFAVPGRSIDPYSAGCNQLIKTQKATIIETGHDILEQLGWKETTQKNAAKQQYDLFKKLRPEQEQIVNFISNHGKVNKELIALHLKQSLTKTSGLLFELELDGIIKSVPGNNFQIAAL